MSTRSSTKQDRHRHRNHQSIHHPIIAMVCSLAPSLTIPIAQLQWRPRIESDGCFVASLVHHHIQLVVVLMYAGHTEVHRNGV
jgi:hypothetical protein